MFFCSPASSFSLRGSSFWTGDYSNARVNVASCASRDAGYTPSRMAALGEVTGRGRRAALGRLQAGGVIDYFDQRTISSLATAN